MIDGFFDISFHLEELPKNGDPLVQLKGSVDWELFRQDLEVIRVKDRKSPVGRKPFDVVLMFKILVLQSLYNLSDDAIEYQSKRSFIFYAIFGFFSWQLCTCREDDKAFS